MVPRPHARHQASNVYAGPVGFYIIRSDAAGEQAIRRQRAQTPRRSGGRAVDPPRHRRPLLQCGRVALYPDSRRPRSLLGPIFLTATCRRSGFLSLCGNCMVVNGKTWPYHLVEPRRYRLRILTGCNSRFLVLKFSDPRFRHVANWHGGRISARAGEGLTWRLLVGPVEERTSSSRSGLRKYIAAKPRPRWPISGRQCQEPGRSTNDRPSHAVSPQSKAREP